jgi:hypothetical protein
MYVCNGLAMASLPGPQKDPVPPNAQLRHAACQKLAHPSHRLIRPWYCQRSKSEVAQQTVF